MANPTPECSWGLGRQIEIYLAGVAGKKPDRAVSVGTQLAVTSPGKVKIGFNSTDSLTYWIDRRRVAPAAVSGQAIVLDLARGLHTMTLVVDFDHRREDIRCVLVDLPDSPARAQFVLRK
jgi:hypothetical protein